MTEIQRKIEDGYVEHGWSPREWATRLHQLADACQAYHPDAAAELRKWADAIQAKHPGDFGTPPADFESPPAVPTTPVRY